jgi:hypothetical protein
LKYFLKSFLFILTYKTPPIFEFHYKIHALTGNVNIVTPEIISKMSHSAPATRKPVGYITSFLQRSDDPMTAASIWRKKPTGPTMKRPTL